MPLKDGAGRVINYLRLSVTDRCNLRCLYCMPEDGFDLVSHENVLTLEEFVEITRRFAKFFGINKVRLTGGEPLIKRNIEFLVREIASTEGITDLAMTTNGILLKQKARLVYDAGLRRLNISLDTLDPVRFEKITRCGSLQDTLDGIKIAINTGFKPIKINTVLLPGFSEEIDFIKWANGNGLILRFIELMPGQPTALDTHHNTAPRMPELLEKIESVYVATEIIESDVTESGKHSVSFVIKSNGWKFEIIPAITQHFCDSCNRLRIDCMGQLRYCLYSNRTIELKPLLSKTDEEFISAVADFVKTKTCRDDENIASYMFSIGG